VIIRDKPGPLELLSAIRGSVLPHIAAELALVMAFSAALVALDALVLPMPHLSATPFATFGIALSLFLGFRNNAAYDRWWEARKLWGGLVADLRALPRELELFLADPASRHRLLLGALAFLHLHRANLRRCAIDADAQAAVSRAGLDVSGAPHPPCAAFDAIGTDLAALHAAGAIDGFGARALSARLGSLALNQAGCERIATTPLPYVYSLLIYRTIWLYCLLVPFAMIGPAGWLAPLFVGIVAYVFFGLAEVTEELAHPFQTSPNGLPLDAICRTVEISLAPHLDRPAPAALTPVDFRLD
jgi:putative membrane protein